MSNYCIISLEKIHSMQSLQGRYDHNYRTTPLSHIDMEKVAYNEELVNFTGMNYRDLWYKRMHDLELKTGKPVPVRRNSVIAMELVTTFSREAEEDVDIEAWKKANMEYMYEQFGKENVLSMQIHFDETTPHIHTIVVPIDDRNRLCAKSFTGGKGKMLHLQQSYADAMKPLGLERGEQYSRSKKQDLNRFYSLLNKAVSDTAPEIMPEEDIKSYSQRVNEYIQDIKMKSLWEQNKLQRNVDLAKTNNAQFYDHYSEAIRLQKDLERSFDGDMDMVRERLLTYRKIEHSVPRRTLATLLTGILKKFPMHENLHIFQEKQKRKKKGLIEEEGNTK